MAVVTENGGREIASGEQTIIAPRLHVQCLTRDLVCFSQSDDPAMLLRESMGVSADGSNRAFPSADVESFMKRIYDGIPIDIHGDSSSNTNHVIVAVDPAGGGSSQFAVFSIIQMPHGSIMVRAESSLASPLPTSQTSRVPSRQTPRGTDSCA